MCVWIVKNSKYLILYCTEERKSYRFGLTWGRVSDFGWTISLKVLNNNNQEKNPELLWQSARAIIIFLLCQASYLVDEISRTDCKIYGSVSNGWFRWQPWKTHIGRSQKPPGAKLGPWKFYILTTSEKLYINYIHTHTHTCKFLTGNEMN